MSDSEEHQHLLTNIHEEESWIAEKLVLVSNDDYGDTLASVLGLLKKHEAFETDFNVHEQRVENIKAQANELIAKVCDDTFHALFITLHRSYPLLNKSC